MKDFASGLSLTPQEAEARRDRLALGVKIAAVAGFGVIIAPLIFTLFKATVALILTGVLALATVSFAPVVAMKFANWKLRAIMEEARRNPIPTLENELLLRRGALGEAKRHLADSLAQVQGFIEQAEDAAKKYPDMADRWRERISKARDLSTLKKNSYRAAVVAVDEFEVAVDRARTEWKLILAEAAMNRSLNVISGDPMAQLKTRVALESVTDGMNRTFAQLEVALLDSVEVVDVNGKQAQPAPAIAMSEPMLLTQINTANKVEVAR